MAHDISYYYDISDTFISWSRLWFRYNNNDIKIMVISGGMDGSEY